MVGRAETWLGNQLTHKTVFRREGHCKPEGGGLTHSRHPRHRRLALGRHIPTFDFENYRSLISQVFTISGAQHRYFKNQQTQLWESQSITNSPTEIQHRNSSLKDTWGIWEGDLLTKLRMCAGGTGVFRDFSENKRAGRHHFSPHPMAYITTCMWEQKWIFSTSLAESACLPPLTFSCRSIQPACSKSPSKVVPKDGIVQAAMTVASITPTGLLSWERGQ